MKASETRQKAREFLKTLSGKYQLFLVSIILAILTISISYTETYHINGTTVNATASVPGIVSILSALFLASASYAVLDVIRHKRDHVEVGDNMRVFSICSDCYCQMGVPIPMVFNRYCGFYHLCCRSYSNYFK